MKAPLLALAMVITASFASAASAADTHCTTTAAQPAISIEAAIGKAETLGYAVNRAKRKKSGCWEIEGYDRNGAEIEIKLDPASGEVVKPSGWRPPAANRG